MATLINFGYRVDEQLSIVEDSISYAVRVTNNLLYETDLNSPYRILVEAQIYTYNQFLLTLRNLEQEIRLIFFELLGFTPLIARKATVTLKFEILETRNENTYFRRNFPVRATNGKIFLTDTALTIPGGSKLGYVTATASKPGTDGNIVRNKINQGLEVIDVAYKVTNESPSTNGTNGETITDLQTRVGSFIRGGGLITSQDVYDYVRSFNPNIVVSVDNSVVTNELNIFVCYRNGDGLTITDFNSVNSEIQRRKPLGVESITVQPMTVRSLYIEVIASINRPQQVEFISSDINSRLRVYVRPDSSLQVQGSTRGIIINNELERISYNQFVEYIQAVSVGLNPESAYAENFVFNPIDTRVKIGTVKVVLIQGSFRSERTFTE